jgi:hypothetical protein
VSDGLDELKRRIAAEHLGNPAIGPRLRGGNEAQLRIDAEEFRREAGIAGSGRPSPTAAIWANQARQRQLAERVFGPRKEQA